MRYRNPFFGILSMVVAGLLLHIFKETGWAIFVERILEETAHSLGIPRAAMVATLSEILLGGGLLWAALYFAFRIGRAERPVPPDPAIEAQRQQTEAILAHTEALKARPQDATLVASGNRGGPVVLAGVVNALMEKALQYGFKMTALPSSDPFIQLYFDIRDSTDPVWIDEQTSQLRRDFLQFCSVVGSDERGVKQLQSDRAELRNFGKQLIGKLTEVGRAEFRKPTPTWSELERRFQELEPLLQYTRIDGQTGSSGDHWRMAGSAGRDAEDRFEAVAKMASAKLFQELPDEVAQYNELASESDALVRWYKALRYIGRRYEASPHIFQDTNEDGSSAGFIHLGSINRPAAASATLCLSLASRN
jgi:hypothetical protein